jgi:hypothetical protein
VGDGAAGPLVVKLRRLDVEGFRSIETLSWSPGDLTVLTGARAEDLLAVALHVSNTARGWSSFAEAFALEPPHPPERFTEGFAETRWFARLGAPEEGSLDLGYELVLERIEQNNGWAIVYERFTQEDDFDLKEMLERRGSRAVFTPAHKGPVLAGTRPPKEQVATLADDMTALGALPAFYNDKRVQPYTERLAGWRRHGRIDPSTEGAPRRFAAERVFHDRLSEDGRNLVNALYSLWDFEPLRAPVLAGLRALDPTVTGLTFPAVGEEGITVALSHEGGGATALAAMSDEAVAWLLRGAMLCAVSPAPLLVLDAVEEGLPAVLIAPLAAMLRAGSARAQVVLLGVSEALDAALTEAFEGAGDGPRLARIEV